MPPIYKLPLLGPLKLNRRPGAFNRSFKVTMFVFTGLILFWIIFYKDTLLLT